MATAWGLAELTGPYALIRLELFLGEVEAPRHSQSTGREELDSVSLLCLRLPPAPHFPRL